MSLSDAWEQARQAWRRLASSSKRASDDEDGLATLSDIGVVRRMLDQAEDKLPKITEVFAAFSKSAPGNYLSSFLYGKVVALEDPARAERLLRESIARNDQFWESHFELGALLEQRGAVQEASQEVRRGIELNPQDPAAHYRLARLYDRLGKTAEAQSERELHAKLSAASPGIK